MTEGDVSLDFEEEKREMEKNMMEMDRIKSTLVPYTLSEDSMDEEEEVELSKHDFEVKQEVNEIKGGEELEHVKQLDCGKQEVDETKNQQAGDQTCRQALVSGQTMSMMTWKDPDMATGIKIKI